MNFKLHLIKVTSHIIRSKEEGLTCFITERGGGVFTSDSEENLKEDFHLSMRLSSAIRNFLYFKGANNANTMQEKMEYIEGMKEKVGNIEYINETV